MRDRRNPEYEAAIEGDRRFFRRHPRRQYRLRLASRAEVEVNGELGHLVSAGAGQALLVVVRAFAPGVRGRIVFTGTADLARDVDQTEEFCRGIWNEAAGREPIKIGRIEAGLRTIAGERA